MILFFFFLSTNPLFIMSNGDSFRWNKQRTLGIINASQYIKLQATVNECIISTHRLSNCKSKYLVNNDEIKLQ